MFGEEVCYGAREVLGGLVGLPTNTRAVRDVILKLVPDLLDVVLAVKDASYNEKPPHAAAISPKNGASRSSRTVAKRRSPSLAAGCSCFWW